MHKKCLLDQAHKRLVRVKVESSQTTVTPLTYHLEHAFPVIFALKGPLLQPGDGQDLGASVLVVVSLAVTLAGMEVFIALPLGLLDR